MRYPEGAHMLMGPVGPDGVDHVWERESLGARPNEDVWLQRPKAMPDGTTAQVSLPLCKCGNRRGPDGGVCCNCAGAIPHKSMFQTPHPETEKVRTIWSRLLWRTQERGGYEPTAKTLAQDHA